MVECLEPILKAKQPGLAAVENIAWSDGVRAGGFNFPDWRFAPRQERWWLDVGV